MTTTIQRIDQLSDERSRLYRFVPDARKDKDDLKQHIREITSELDQLWDLRRRERVGQLDGIDLLIERSYAQIYGEDFRDVVSPAAVEEESKPVALVA